MRYDEALNFTKKKLAEYLRGKRINYNEPFTCLNPAHHDLLSHMRYNSEFHTIACSECGAIYDIFDVIGLDYGSSSPEESRRRAFWLYNVQIDYKDHSVSLKLSITPELKQKLESAAKARGQTPEEFAVFILDKSIN
jgi:replicative DNA helicase